MGPDASRGGLEPAVEASARAVDAGEREAFAIFARALLAGADTRAVRTRGATTLAEVARQSFALLRRRAPRRDRRVRLHEPADRPGRTVVEVLQDDRPFLVDTVRLALRRHALAEQLLLHPIRHGAARRGRGAPRPRRRAGRASRVVHLRRGVPAPRERGRARRASSPICGARSRSSRDVTDDHRRMVRAVRELWANVEYAGALRSRTGRAARPRSAASSTGSSPTTSCSWASAPTRSPARATRSRCGSRASPASACGGDDATSRFVEPQRGAEMPEEIRRMLADPRIILISKARIESRIHRAGRLDRVLRQAVRRGGARVGLHDPRRDSSPRARCARRPRRCRCSPSGSRRSWRRSRRRPARTATRRSSPRSTRRRSSSCSRAISRATPR